MAEDDGSDLHFLPPRRKKMKVVTSVCTGHSNTPPGCCTAIGSDPSSLFSANKKAPPCRVVLFYWQRMRDSNPRKRSQSPVCYRYTNPLYQEQAYYTHYPGNVKHYFSNRRNFSERMPGKDILPGDAVFYSPSRLITVPMVLKMIFQSTQKLRSWIYFRSSAIQSSKLISFRRGWICQ